MRDRISAGLVAIVLSLSCAQSCVPTPRPPLADPVAAGPLEDGQAAYQRGDYATALLLFRPLADEGHAHAQFNLGVMYAEGHGVPQDYTEAVKWYRKAADQGNAYAQFALGLIYEKGRGVPQDYVEALKWYRKAADQGNPWAQLSLGLMYATGQGVPQDYVQAYKWFTLAGAAENRDRAAAMMTPAQIAEAERLASEWRPTK